VPYKRFTALIETLRNQLDVLPLQKRLFMLESIFVFGDETDTEGTALFGVISEHLRFAVWFFLDVLDALPSKRFQTVCEAMRAGSAVFTISDTTALFERAISGGNEASRVRERFADLTDEIVNEMKLISVAAIERAAAENRLSAVSGLAPVLYRWKQWGDPGRASAWISETFLTNPKGAAALVAAFAQTATSMGTGDRVPRVHITVPVKVIREFVNLNLVEDLLRKTNDQELTDKERTAKARFFSAKAKVDAGKEPDELLFFDDEK